MKIQFLGAAHEVTGSCTLLEACGVKILVDCGMEQGADIYENAELPVSPADISAVLVTHAHIDHTGKIPLLTKNGFSGKIYSTKATEHLCAIMLADSAHIQETEAESNNRRAKRSGDKIYEPMYTQEDVQATVKLFRSVPYEVKTEISDGITVEFFNAGHLFGSSSIAVTVNEGGDTKTVVFSGDIGTYNRPLLVDPIPPRNADYVVIESTYGDRLHERIPDGREERLAEIIKKTLSRGGNVVIPSFAVGRTQELLYMIRNIKEAGRVPFDFSVWLDSPLAIEATHIYSGADREFYDDETLEMLDRGKNPILFDGLKIALSSDESRFLNTDRDPKVIISASGMCEAGRIRHHLKHNLWRPESTVLFVGYQVAGTLGQQLLSGKNYVNILGEEIAVRADIEQLGGTSGHADRDAMLAWLRAIGGNINTVFVNHGEDKVTQSFAETVTRELGIAAIAPFSGGEYSLGNEVECLALGVTKKIVKRKNVPRRTGNAAYDRLISAVNRLQTVVDRSRNAKLRTRDITSLTDRVKQITAKLEDLSKKRK